MHFARLPGGVVFSLEVTFGGKGGRRCEINRDGCIGVDRGGGQKDKRTFSLRAA